MGIYSHKKHIKSKQYLDAMDRKNGEELKRKGWRTPYGFIDFIEPVTYQDALKLSYDLYKKFAEDDKND